MIDTIRFDSNNKKLDFIRDMIETCNLRVSWNKIIEDMNENNGTSKMRAKRDG